MPSLLSKYKKRRESHKADDGSSVTSHEADQRSPSGSSVRSGDGVLGGAAVGGLAAAANGNQFTQQLPQSAQQGVQQAQQAGQKVLHSPFLGQHSPQTAANQQSTGTNASANTQSLNGSGAAQTGAQHASAGQPGAPGSQNTGPAGGPAGKNGFHASPNGHPQQPGVPRDAQLGASSGAPQGYAPHAPPHAPQAPQHMLHGGQPGQAANGGPHSPMSPPHGQPPYGQPPHGPPPHGQPPHGQPPHGQPPMPHNRGPGGMSPQSPGMYAAAAGAKAPGGSPGAAGSDPLHERDRQFQQRYRQPPHAAYKSPLSEPSETPWAEYAIQRACPSPRFGHSANYIAARDGELFIMGGIRDSDIMSDLWVIDTNMLTGYQLVTEGARVGARVGHSSLVLGNAHVMFGGDTKIEETDPLDDNLYLLNTSSLKWTVAQPVGPRPTGRYGHSLSNVGARIYVFGGQVDEQFYNDMWAFDLQSWRSPSARWELVQPASEPPTPRTNHTVVTWNDKLYLFGGANGDLWYSDTWCFDPVTRRWDQLDCTGYVPAPCQGHAATIIGDVMYVFGGMSSQGVLIDQLFALKLTTLKWYTFQNLGPGPSPRSGHSLTAFTTDKILVWGGTDQGNSAYVLDVSRINYPDDHAETAAQQDVPHGAPAVVPPARPTADSETRDVASDMSPQPRLQSSDNSGPTQGRANPAARNSMLFAKRRSVIAPSSPLRGAATPDPENLNGSPRGVPEKSPLQQQSTALDGPNRPQPEPASDRTPNRTHITPTSYVSETEGSSDERFVSAVDLNDNQTQLGGDKNASDETPRRSRGHTRGQSLAGAPLAGSLDEPMPEVPSTEVSRNNTLTRADVDGPKSQDKEFQSMESELGGMPGGLPNKPFTGADSGDSGFDAARSEESLGSIPRELNASSKDDLDESEDALASRTPGLRRSQPQTNLALRSLNDDNANADAGSGSTADADNAQDNKDADRSRHSAELAAAGIGAVGAAGAGIIGLSDQMNLPPDSHAAQSQQVPGMKAAQTRGLNVGAPSGEDEALKAKTSNIDRSAADSSRLSSSNGTARGVDPLGRSPSNKSAYGAEASSPSSATAPLGAAAPLAGAGAKEADAPQQKAAAEPTTSPVRIPSQSSQRHHARTPSSVSTEGAHDVSSTPLNRGVAADVKVADPQSQSSPKDVPSVTQPSTQPSMQPSTQTPRGLDTPRTQAADFAAVSPASASATAELAQLRQQLNAYRQRDLDGEHHKLKEAHAARERELLGLRDSHGQLQSETAHLKDQHQDLQQRYAHVQKLMDGHVSTLQAQQQALDAANAKLQSQQQELSRVPILERENADLKHQLQTAEAARKHAEQQLEQLNATHSELRSAHADLTDKHSQLRAVGAGAGAGAGAGEAGALGATSVDAQVNQLVQLWAEYNRGTSGGAPAAAGTRDLASGPGEDYRSLYETHKTAADSAQRELEAAYSEQAQLKAQLRELSAMQSSAPSTADLDLLKEQHQTALSQLDKQHQEALLQARQASTQDSEELRARLRRLEASFEELNAEYQKAVDLSKNQQNALARTREELNMSRAHAQSLEEQLEDASIRAAPANETGDVSTQSVGSARNDQAALVIRDLRAQIVILEEEMQSQREQIMRLKKAALTTAQ